MQLSVSAHISNISRHIRTYPPHTAAAPPYKLMSPTKDVIGRAQLSRDMSLGDESDQVRTYQALRRWRMVMALVTSVTVPFAQGLQILILIRGATKGGQTSLTEFIKIAPMLTALSYTSWAITALVIDERLSRRHHQYRKCLSSQRIPLSSTTDCELCLK